MAAKPRKTRTVEFRHLLDESNALRAWFELEQGRVIQFSVQLECRFVDEWIPVVRYDTAHDFAHCDRLHPYEPAKKMSLITRDYNDALTFAIQDLTDNWNGYRERYEKWLKQK